jgi:hypothetical protein
MAPILFLSDIRLRVRAAWAIVCLTVMLVPMSGCGAKPPTFGEIVAEVANEPPPAPEAAPAAPEEEPPPNPAAPAAPEPPKTVFEQLTTWGAEDEDDARPTTLDGWVGLVQGRGSNRFVQIVIEHPEAEKVTSLNLAGLKFVNDEGTAGLERLTGLERLDLGGAGTESGTLSRAAKLPALKEISLEGSVIQGPIDLGESPFPALERLKAGGSRLNREALLAIARMPELRYLEFANADLTSEAVMLLKPLMKLEELDFSYNSKVGDVGLAELVNAKQLRVLNLAKTGVHGPGLLVLARAGVFDYLTDLDLTECALADEMAPALMAMPQLDRLNLRLTPIQDRGLSLIPQLKVLRHLSLEQCRSLNMAGFVYLKGNLNLETLNLAQNGQLGDAMLPILATMKSLKKLNLIHCGFSAEGVQRLQEVLPLTEILVSFE